MTERKHTGGNALMNAEPVQPKKILSFGEIPVDRSTTTADQIPAPVNQIATPPPELPAVNRSTGQPDIRTGEALWRSRRERRAKGLRLPVSKLEAYERWCFEHKIDFQDAVEMGLDWLTGQPVNRIAGQPDSQIPALINNDLNNSLVINDEKAKQVFAEYARLTGRSMSPKDVEQYRQVAQLSTAFIIEVMQRTKGAADRAGNRINGFGYFATAILKTAPPVSVSPAIDISKCPTCRGGGWDYPEGPSGPRVRCSHAELKSTS